MIRAFKRLASNLMTGKQMNNATKMEVREISYQEPFGYTPPDEPQGRTRVVAESISKDDTSVMLWMAFPGKRDDIRVGQIVSCEVTLHGAEAHE